ncbi:thiol peroxidase [Sulfurovum sp.]|uniref:thiol peroxidase n=1 Tax=Sulfurovum sp. TaxID=1969726 RepID=UPI0035639735
MKKILAFVLLTASLCATTVMFKGEEVTLNSKGLNVGMQAPIFTAVDKDFMEVTVGGKSDKIQVIAFIPSFDSDVCKRETIVFNQKVSKMKNVNLMVISKDLPFALGRFFHDNKIKNIMTLSDYKDANNVLRYGATISSPIYLEGFFGRVVYVVDTNGEVTYKEVVQELSNEPNYENIIKAVNRLTH